MKKPDHALLAGLADILETRGATFENFECHVDARDNREPIRSYGLLFDCARECWIGEASAVEEGDDLTPDEREYLQKRAARDARARGNSNGGE
jgi:hypothetical protein